MYWLEMSRNGSKWLESGQKWAGAPMLPVSFSGVSSFRCPPFFPITAQAVMPKLNQVLKSCTVVFNTKMKASKRS